MHVGETSYRRLMRLLIATPTSDSSCRTDYVTSVLRLQKFLLLKRPDIELVGPIFPTSSQVSAARNALSSRVLDDAAISHILFVDSDVGFRPEAVVKLCDYGEPFCGCLYPARQVNRERFFAAAAQSANGEAAWRAGLDFVGHSAILKTEGAIKVARGFVEVTALGGGLTLVARAVLERMRDAYPHLVVAAGERQLQLGAAKTYAQFFESMPNDKGVYLSEDLAFSKRWTDIGGRIWACVDEEVSHFGPISFAGKAVDRLKADTDHSAANLPPR